MPKECVASLCPMVGGILEDGRESTARIKYREWWVVMWDFMFGKMLAFAIKLKEL